MYYIIYNVKIAYNFIFCLFTFGYFVLLLLFHCGLNFEFVRRKHTLFAEILINI